MSVIYYLKRRIFSCEFRRRWITKFYGFCVLLNLEGTWMTRSSWDFWGHLQSSSLKDYRSVLKDVTISQDETIQSGFHMLIGARWYIMYWTDRKFDKNNINTLTFTDFKRYNRITFIYFWISICLFILFFHFLFATGFFEYLHPNYYMKKKS